jgi:hypothetical protein
MSKSINKSYQIIVSSKQNYDTYYIVSSYATLEEAQANYETDLKQFQTEYRHFWLCNCYGYDAIIKDSCMVA